MTYQEESRRWIEELEKAGPECKPGVETGFVLACAKYLTERDAVPPDKP